MKKILFMILLVMISGTCSFAEIINLNAKQAKALIASKNVNTDFFILDVRTPFEYKTGHIKGAVNIDYYSRMYIVNIQKLNRKKEYLIYCRSGNRSGKSLKMMDRMGFKKIYNLQKGIKAWKAAKYPLVR